MEKNYRKDGIGPKIPEYFERKIGRLEQLTNEYYVIHQKLTRLLQAKDPYFTIHLESEAKLAAIKTLFQKDQQNITGRAIVEAAGPTGIETSTMAVHTSGATKVAMHTDSSIHRAQQGMEPIHGTQEAVSHLQLTNSSYEAALAILEKQFTNIRQAATEYMDSILDMKKLDYRSAVGTMAWDIRKWSGIR